MLGKVATPLLALALAIAVAQAQATAACNRGTTGDRCKGQVLAEMGFALRTAGTGALDSRLWTWEFGGFRDNRLDHAFGISVFAQVGGVDGIGPRARYRWWRPGGTVIDVGAGFRGVALPAPSAFVAVSRSHFALTAHVVHDRGDAPRNVPRTPGRGVGLYTGATLREMHPGAFIAVTLLGISALLMDHFGDS